MDKFLWPVQGASLCSASPGPYTAPDTLTLLPCGPWLYIIRGSLLLSLPGPSFRLGSCLQSFLKKTLPLDYSTITSFPGSWTAWELVSHINSRFFAIFQLKLITWKITFLFLSHQSPFLCSLCFSAGHSSAPGITSGPWLMFSAVSTEPLLEAPAEPSNTGTRWMRKTQSQHWLHCCGSRELSFHAP